MGTLLLDPKNGDVNDTGGVAYANPGNALFSDLPGGNSVIRATGAGSISAQIANVVLQFTNDLTFTSQVNIANPGTTLTAQAGRSIIVNNNIFTNNADIRLTANDNTVTANRDAGAATFTMAPGTHISAGGGNVFLALNAGTGHAGVSDSGNMVIANVTGNNVSIVHDGLTANSAILRAGNIANASPLITAATSVFVELQNAAGAGASIGTSLTPMQIQTPVLESHYHSAGGGIFFNSPNAGNLQIGGVPTAIFSGSVRGVQTLSGGPIEIKVNGNLVQSSGACGTAVSGGPICSTGSGNITLTANDLTSFLGFISAAGNLNLALTGRLRLEDTTAGAGGTLTVNAASIQMLSNGIAQTLLTSVGTQSITTSDVNGIYLQGASGAAANKNVQITQTGATGTQTITANGGGTVRLTASNGSGNNNFVQIDAYGTAQSITLSGGGGVQLDGGTVGNLNFARIRANNPTTGAQTQTIAGAAFIQLIGGNSGGAASLGNFANISNTAGNQNITAGSIFIGGGAGGIANNAQIRTAGTGSTQTINANSIVLMGGTGGGAEGASAISSDGNFAQLRGDFNQDITVGAGGIVVMGGSGAGADHFAQIRQGQVSGGFTPGSHQTIIVNGGGNITLTGGSTAQIPTANGDGGYGRIRGEGNAQTINFTAGGSTLTITGGTSGAQNRAEVVTNNGTQTITGSPTVIITAGTSGGVSGNGNGARIRADVGLQTLTLGTTQLTGGTGGTDNFAVIQSPNQNITVNGNLTLTGSTAGAGSGGSRIGGLTDAVTNLGLIVHGTVTLNGGALANAGSALGPSNNSATPQTGTVTVTADGNITLNAGTVAGSRIGQPSGLVGGGNVIVTSTGGNIVLNNNGTVGTAFRSAGNVTVHADGAGKTFFEDVNSTLVANALTITSGGATTLLGINQTNLGASITTAGGNVTIVADVPNISTINAGAGTVFFRPRTIGYSIVLETGTTTPNALSLDPAGGQNITAGTLQLGDADSAKFDGNIDIKSLVTTGSVNVGTVLLVGNNVTITPTGQVGTAASRFAHNVTIQSKNDININGSVFMGNNSLVLNANRPGGIGAGSVYIIALGAPGTAPVTVDTQGGITVSGVDFKVGGPLARYNTTVTAGGNLDVTLTGNLSVVAADTRNTSGTIRDVSAKLHANGKVEVTAAGVTVAAGYAEASGSVAAAESAKANAELSADGGMMLTIGGSGLKVGTGGINGTGGAVAKVYATAGDTYDASANTTLSAGAGMTITIAGGGLSVGRGFALASAQGGGAKATANANTEVKAGAGSTLSINAYGGVTLSGGQASAEAFHFTGGSSSVARTGDNKAEANAVTTFSAGNNLIVTGNGAVNLNSRRADAFAYHHADGGEGNTLGGNNTATANAPLTFTAGGGLTINAPGGLNITGSNASAHAFKWAVGNGHTLSGNNTATANSTIELKGASVTLELGGAGLSVQGRAAQAKAYHQAGGSHGSYGSSVRLSGTHDATANSNITLEATGGMLKVNAGGVSIGYGIGGGSANAQAYMYAGYNTNDNVLGGAAGTAANTATVNTNITLKASGNTELNLGAGSLSVQGSHASAQAYHSASGGLSRTNKLTGNNAANANSLVAVTAGGELKVTAAGGVHVNGRNADAKASQYAAGNSHAVSGTNLATANSNIELKGASVTLTLDLNEGGGSLTISGADGIAKATQSVNDLKNNVSGNQTATANSNISLTATGGALKVNATGGGASINGGSATADAYKSVSGSMHTVGGDNTATANSRINVSGGSLAFTLGTRSFTAYASYAKSRAYHDVSGTSNTLSGAHSAAADATITFTATSGDLTIAAGSFNAGANAYGAANAYMQAGGSNNTVGVAATASNSATANNSITFTAPGGKLDINVGSGGFTVNSSSLSASAYAYHKVTGGAGNKLKGNNTATNNANVSFNAGTDLKITAGSMTVNGSSIEATASAYKQATGNNHRLEGINTATANANVTFTAGNDLTVSVGGGPLRAGNSSVSATAYAYHRVNTGTGNILSDNNTAKATADLVFSAGNKLTITAGSLTTNSNDAYASAYKQVSGDGNSLSGNNAATGSAQIRFTAGNAMKIMLTGGLNVYGSYTSAYAKNIVTSGNNNTLGGNNTANAGASVIFSAGSTLDIQAGSVTLDAGSAYRARASNAIAGTGNAVGGANNATADTNIRLFAGGNLAINAQGSVTFSASNANAYAQSANGEGNTVTATNTATAYANVLAVSGGDMMIKVTGGDLTVQAQSAYSKTSGAGVNTANANANAASFALGAKTVDVTGAVNLNGGSATVDGPGATAFGFAMLDPGSLTLTAGGLNLSPNESPGDGVIRFAGVVLSAFGPIKLTLEGSPVDFAAYKAQFANDPGRFVGETSIISSEPIKVSIADPLVLNLTNLFGLPAGLLKVPQPNFVVPSPPADIFRPIEKIVETKPDNPPPDKPEKKSKEEKKEEKEEKQISKGLKAECD